MHTDNAAGDGASFDDDEPHTALPYVVFFFLVRASIVSFKGCWDPELCKTIHVRKRSQHLRSFRTMIPRNQYLPAAPLQ